MFGDEAQKRVTALGWVVARGNVDFVGCNRSFHALIFSNNCDLYTFNGCKGTNKKAKHKINFYLFFFTKIVLPLHARFTFALGSF